MEAAVQELRNQMHEMQQRLEHSERSQHRLARLLDESRAETKRLEVIAQQARPEDGMGKWALVDFKTMTPESFSNKPGPSFRNWVKNVKAFTIAKLEVFRTALELAEKNERPTDRDERQAQNWAPMEVANTRLYDMLVMFTADDRLIVVENHMGEGVETWRQLAKRYDPTGDIFAFDTMSALMSRPRCKDVRELGSAIEKWVRDMQRYTAKTGETLPDKWKLPILFQMVPKKNYAEIKTKWQMCGHNDVGKFASDLVVFCTELQYEQWGTRDRDAMDLSELEWYKAVYKNQNPDYHDPSMANMSKEDFQSYCDKVRSDAEAHLDWFGQKGSYKGQGGRGKGGKRRGVGKGYDGKSRQPPAGWKGNAAAGSRTCHWFGKPRHMKKECRDLAEYKKKKTTKSESRKDLHHLRHVEESMICRPMTILARRNRNIRECWDPPGA